MAGLRVLVLGLLAIAAPVAAQQATVVPGAVIRLLDKVSGQLEDVEMLSGQIARLGGLDIKLSECRYPSGNPSGDAWAYLTIEDRQEGADIFKGWMVASSPALNPLDHPRYDVWVLRCKTF